MEELRINIENLIKNKITLDQYFILYSLNFKDSKTLSKYIEATSVFEVSIIKDLEKRNFISVKNYDNLCLESISLTTKAKLMFAKESSFTEEFIKTFEDLKNTYPKKVSTGNGGVRRLHQDLERCRKLYRETIVKNNSLDLNLHEKIKKAIRVYYSEKERANELPFVQLMATFLHGKTWEQYLEDIDNSNILIKQSDDI